MSSAIGRPPARAIQRLGAPVPAPRSRTTGHATAGLPLVPALEEGPSKGAAPRLVHQPGGRRLLVDLDLLGVEGEGGEDVSVLPGALGRGGADVALRPGVVRKLKGALRESRAGLVAGAGGQLGAVAGNVHHGHV